MKASYALNSTKAIVLTNTTINPVNWKAMLDKIGNLLDKYVIIVCIKLYYMLQYYLNIQIEE